MSAPLPTTTGPGRLALRLFVNIQARGQRRSPLLKREARRGATRAAVPTIAPSTPLASVSRTRPTVVMPPTARMVRSQAPAFRHARSSCTCTRQCSHTASPDMPATSRPRSEEHTSELQSRENLVCRLLLEKKKKKKKQTITIKKKKKNKKKEKRTEAK